MIQRISTTPPFIRLAHQRPLESVAFSSASSAHIDVSFAKISWNGSSSWMGTKLMARCFRFLVTYLVCVSSSRRFVPSTNRPLSAGLLVHDLADLILVLGLPSALTSSVSRGLRPPLQGLCTPLGTLGALFADCDTCP